MSKKLRLAILLILREHHNSGSAEFKEDVDLAQVLEEPISEIQDQLDILELEDLVTLVKTFGPSYGVRITPQGLLYLEQIEELAQIPKRGPLGFRTPEDE